LTDDFYISNDINIKNEKAENCFNKVNNWIKKESFILEETSPPYYLKFRFYFPLHQGDFGRSTIIKLTEINNDVLIHIDIPKPILYEGSIYQPVELYDLLLKIYKLLGITIDNNLISDIYSDKIITDILNEINNHIKFILFLFIISSIIVFLIFFITNNYSILIFLLLDVLVFVPIIKEDYEKQKRFLRIKHLKKEKKSYK
jgi:hypothetical protein